MGFLTSLTIHNDALHEFMKHPKEFAEAIFKGIDEANRAGKEVDVPFSNYSGYLTVQKSRHADDSTIYLHYGNSVFDLNAWGKDFEELLKRNPNVAEEFVKKADSLIKESKAKIKENKSKRSSGG